jgi:HK97 gp10 family phage protein
MADLDIEIVTNIEGLDELEEAFTEGSKRAVKKFLRHVEMEASKPIIEEAKQTAPYLTGALENDLHRESVVGDGELTLRIGPSQKTFYGLIQELGDAHVPALHWLETAARSRQDEVREKYNEALTVGLEDMKK